ncbi:hypothetical protein BSLG_000184 [Batrachochytrium salamandrivorans]|nr:hypothetical protein BSLG_000184 [Batrachochytrium salamandrivorans]
MATHISEPTDATSEPISNEMHQQKVLVRKAVSELIATHHPTVPPTPEFVYAVSELVVKFAGLMGSDLESFSRHGKRTVVSAEDVKLFARRNPRLLEMIRSTEAAGVLNKPSSAASRKKQQQG